MTDISEMFDINDAVMRYCRSLLWDSSESEAMCYLRDSGLSDESIKMFDLGFIGEDGGGVIAHLKGLGYTGKEYEPAGILINEGSDEIWDYFRDAVIFPIKNKEGRITGFSGRKLHGNSKWFHTPMPTPIFHSWQSLFGMDLAHRSNSDYYILCEGYIDTLLIHQAGFDMAVNFISVNSDHPFEGLDLDVNKQVLLAFDTDNYGRKQCDIAQKSFEDMGYKVGIVDISPYRDPAEFIRKEGPDAFKERVLEAKASI